jgi:hypothetical protein
MGSFRIAAGMKTRHRLLAALMTVLWLSTAGAASPIQSYERGQPSQPRHVLVAAQGGMFKSQLLGLLLKRLEERPIHIKVIDVTALGSIDASRWQAIVLIHDWEAGHPPPAVDNFLARLADKGKVVDVTTSSSGREKVPGVDVVSSASVRTELPDLVTQVAAKVEARLAAPPPGTTGTH